MAKNNNVSKKSLLSSFGRLDYLFFGFILLSFFYHSNRRMDHYQELDSDWAYLSLQEFPQMAYSYISWSSYKRMPAMGLEKAQQIAKNRNDVRILRRGGPLAQFPDSTFLTKLAEMPYAKYKRLKYINEAASARYSYGVQSMYALPYTTTYSPGMGLLYGWVTKARQRYEEFNSSALLLTLLLFHISGLMLFFLLRRVSNHTLFSAIAALLYLSSISLYSYAYHLGSTVWNFATAVIWLYLVIRYFDHKRYALILGGAGAAIILFNYLFVFYYAATMIVVFFVKYPLKTITQNIKEKLIFIGFQIPTIIATLWVITHFLQAGQGVRGNISSISQFPSYFYYILLNFFGLFRGELVDIIQFVIFSILLAMGIYCSIRRFKENKKFTLLIGVSGLTLVFYVIAVFLGQLGFAPTRHILFLSPVMFTLIFIGLSPFAKIIEKLKISEVKLIGIMLVCGVGIYLRSTESNDMLADFTPNQQVDEVVLIDKMTFRDYYNLRPNTTISQGFPSQNFSPDRVYLYLSQTIPFDSTFKRWEQSFQGQIDFEKLQEDNREMGVYFTNHNPYPKDYNFSRPNNLYATVFKLKPKGY